MARPNSNFLVDSAFTFKEGCVSPRAQEFVVERLKRIGWMPPLSIWLMPADPDLAWGMTKVTTLLDKDGICACAALETQLYFVSSGLIPGDVLPHWFVDADDAKSTLLAKADVLREDVMSRVLELAELVEDERRLRVLANGV